MDPTYEAWETYDKRKQKQLKTMSDIIDGQESGIRKFARDHS